MALGHRNITTTMHYVELYKQIYSNDTPRKFITKIASTKEERIALSNDGRSILEKGGDQWYFRKPK